MRWHRASGVGRWAPPTDPLLRAPITGGGGKAAGFVDSTNWRGDDLLLPHESRAAPVGLFDSGWGGLSVALAIRAALPGQDLVYVGDHAWQPYGGRDAGTIRRRSVALSRELVGRGCRVVVVACNTASSAALDDVRASAPGVPIVGVVPPVKPAAARSRSGRIVVLATPATARGAYLAGLVADHAPGMDVDVVPAPGLVDFVERGETDGPKVEAALRDLLGPSLAAGADAVVLGCTHYPFLRPAMERVCGSGVAVIDCGEAIARRLGTILGVHPASESSTGQLQLLTTGNLDAVSQRAADLLAEAVEVGRVDA